MCAAVALWVFYVVLEEADQLYIKLRINVAEQSTASRAVACTGRLRERHIWSALELLNAYHRMSNPLIVS